MGSTDCTLRSLGIPTPTVQQSQTVPSFRLEPVATIIDAVEPKKPSYLNLACTVNGYSNITNYDSKLRENFRISKSRDVSPIRPQDYHASRDQNGEPSKFLTPNYSKPLLISPPPTASNMADSKSQTILRSSQNSSYSYSSTSTRTMTFMSKETRNFASNMLYNTQSDTVDNAASFNPKTNGVQTKFSSFESSKLSQHAYTNINGKASSMSETSIQENYSNGQQAKSFIQQRVERLYGPGALAQGFFISKRTKNRLSYSDNETTTNGTVEYSPPQQQQQLDTSLENDTSLKQSSSSPSLPVLRHLRPEFRAQLPILSPKRLYNDNIMQKSTTVPSSLTTVATSNGVEENKLLLNGSKTTESIAENKENIAELVIDDKLNSKQQQIPVKLDDLNSVTIITEEIPAAPQVILPVVNGDVVNGSDVNRNIPKKAEVRDGHYFLKILKNETDRLICLAEKAEAQLEEKKTVLADDVLGYLRSASGKARLLVSQKMQQFEGKTILTKIITV